MRWVTTPAAAFRSAIDPWFTAPIVPVLRRRREALLGSLEGSVLTLTGPPAELPPESRISGDSDGQPVLYSHIVTVGWLSAADQLDRTLGELLALLSPDGWLHSIEATSGPAPIARAQRLSAPVGRVRTGWHLGRDVPAALRRRGLVVTDVDRFSMPVASTVLKPWVQTRARFRADTRPPGRTSATIETNAEEGS